MVTNRFRGIVSALCVTLGVLLVLIALLIGYARRAVFNERAFSAHISASLEDPRVANFVAEQIADAVIEASPDLMGLRPVLVGVGRGVVSSAPFRAAFRRATRAAHHAIMSGTAVESLLNVRDLGIIYNSAASSQPGLQRRSLPGSPPP